MIAQCLGSSSSGNCFILKFQNESFSRSIMVECGFTLKEIQKKMLVAGLSLNDIEACLVTHGHQDHARAINELASRYIPVWGSKETVEAIKINAHPMEPLEDYCITPDIFVTPFEVEHDIAGSLGFFIHCRFTDENVLFINDCKYSKADFGSVKFDYIFIECNYIDKQVRKLHHDAELAQNHIMIARYSRLINAHMSLYGTLKTLKDLDFTKCKGIFLMHLSDGHANEYFMKTAVKNATKVPTFVCGKYGGIK